jgi:hypothetical protein
MERGHHYSTRSRMSSSMTVPGVVAPTLRRLLLGGVALAAVMWVAGEALERGRFGADQTSARAKLEAEVTNRFSSLGDQLDRAVRELRVEPATVRLADQQDVAATRALFDRVARVAELAGPNMAITIYSANHAPLAWNRGSAVVPDARLSGEASRFLGPSAQGLQLVRVEPLVDRADAARQGGVVVVSVPLESDQPVVGEPTFSLSTSIVPVTVRPGFEAQTDVAPESFIVRSATGEALAVIGVPTDTLTRARDAFRARRLALELAIVAVLALLLSGPLLDWRSQTTSLRAGATLTAAVALLFVVARALCWVALRRADLAAPPLTPTASWFPVLSLFLASPADFALTSLLCVGLVTLAVSSFSTWRLRRHGVRAPSPSSSVTPPLGACWPPSSWATSDFWRHTSRKRRSTFSASRSIWPTTTDYWSPSGWSP